MQSQFHDIRVAKDLGFSTAWIERRHDRQVCYPVLSIPCPDSDALPSMPCPTFRCPLPCALTSALCLDL